MLGGVHTDLLVTTLLFLSQTGTLCRAENDLTLVPLPEWRTHSEYVTQCFYDRHNNLSCDWTRNQQISVDVAVSIFESGRLGMEGEACLEFWYQSPVTANGSELRAFLKSSDGLVEIWTSPILPRNSWTQVFVPLNIVKPESRVVLEAVAMAGRITINKIGVRRGSCGPQCESNTELWTDESTRCLCSEGQLSCTPSPCPQGQTCGPHRGSSRGISTTGTCTIHSHTDCSTFDGVLFRFMAPCTYILAKTCSPTEDLPMFSVEVVNKQNGNSSLPAIQQVNVDTGNIRVSLLKRQMHRVVVNGVWRKLPLSLSSGTVNIKSNPAAVVLETSFGLTVSFDSAGAVHVTLPSAYSNEACGLCGNFNDIREDDLRKPDGTNAQDATALAQSWQTGQSTSSCETILVPHQCDPQEESGYTSELYCGRLLSSTGPFADCQSVLGVESYFRACVVGMCSAHGDPAVLCETLQVYSDICKEAGVAVPMWRNSTFCPLQCAENSHYDSCAYGCPEVCSGLDLTGSCGNCEERCVCDSGFKLSGGKCVPAEDCGCWYNGKHYEKGDTFVEGECEQQCQCRGNNDLWCTSMQCAYREVCKVEEGVKDCFPFKPATCRVYGDPHYITFDKVAYDFQGGCSYTLTTTCGEEGSVQFTVIGHNMHPPLQNYTRSKLEAVTLQVEDFCLTLNQSGEVHVNNSRVQLPYITDGTYGLIRAYMKNNYIVLEAAFGLRVMVDGQSRLFVQVDERYKYELCGLCGTYSEYQGDEFVTPGGQNVTEPFEFGDSWRVPNHDECTVYPNDPRVCDYDEENDAYNECNTLLKDAFNPCHEIVHPDIYLNSCVYDYCATNGDQHTLCESLKSYATACQVAGVKLPFWQADTACAEPPTTTASPTTPTSPTPDQTFCPMNCDFEKNLCGWEQLIQDSFDWTRHLGPTPSNLTGPMEDHTTGAGFYIYIEGDSVIHGDSARLMSPKCHYNGPLCLQFWYHMYGSASAMAINIYLLKDNKATKLWSMMNNQGPKWHPGNFDISVSGPFQIIVEGIRGSDAQSDVAIDDVSIHFGSCSGRFPSLVDGTELPSTTAEVLPSHPVCNIDCSFDSNLCSWNQMLTDVFDWTWQNGTTPSLMTGPSTDHTGDGHYLYIEANSATHGDTARLISSECSDSGPQCLQFWYHMYGSADTMGLHVYLLQGRLAKGVWWKRNDQGNMWHLAQVDFTTTGTFQIIVEGRRGSNDQSDVAVDDVSIHRGPCADLTEPKTPAPELPPTISSSATQQPTTTSSKPQPPSTTKFMTTTTITTATSNPDDPMTTRPDIPTTTGPQLPITSRPITTAATGPKTTATPHPKTTEGTEVETSEQPVSETTVRPQPSTTTQPKPHTSSRPQTTTTEHTEVETTEQPELETTEKPQPSTTTQPQSHTTAAPLPPSTAIPHPQTTAESQTTNRPQTPITTSQPQTTVTPQLTTTVQPQPPTTTQPKLPTTAPSESQTSTSHPPTTTTSNPQTTTPLESQTTSAPQPSTTTAKQQPSTTAGPKPSTTMQSQTPNTAPPSQTTTAGPPSQTNTAGPPSQTNTAGPSSQTTTARHPSQTTTARPQTQTTTAGPPSQTTTAGPPSQTTTARHPSQTTTARPPSQTTTAGPPSQTTTARHPSQTTGPPSQTTTARPPSQTTTAGPPSQTTTAGPQTQTTTSGPPSQTTTARPPSQTTTARPPSQNTTAGPPSQTNTAGPPSQTTTSGPPSQTNTARPQTQTTTAGPPSQTTAARPQTQTTAARPQTQTTAARPQTQTTTSGPPSQTTTAGPPSQTTTAGPPSQTTAARPPSQTTTSGPPSQTTTAGPPSQTTTAGPPSQTTTAGPPSQTTTAGSPSQTTTTEPQPPTTARPQPPSETQTTSRPQQSTTAKPQTTTVTPQSTTTLRPEPTTTAGPQPTTTLKPHPPTERPQSTVTTQSTTTARPKPPTTAVPTPSCPQNSHYTTCIPACSPTCRHLNGPPRCSDSDSCVPGCVCDDGFVQKGQRCLPIQECGCVDSSGNKHHFNDRWYTNHCSQKCECEKDDGIGTIDCDDKDECDGNAVCLQNNEGEWYCRSTGFSECTINGDPEYRTFDKMKYEFEGEHSYVLVQTKNLPNDIPDVYIVGINTRRVDDGDDGDDSDDSEHHDDSSSEENHSRRVGDEEKDDDDGDEADDDNDRNDRKYYDDSDEDEEHPRLQELKIIVYNHTVEMRKNRELVVDGKKTKMPVSPTAGLNIRQHSSRIYLKTDFGLSVEFNGRSSAEIILPHIYKRKVRGLCGNFDSQKRNDWMKPDGTMARSVREFGESWRV